MTGENSSTGSQARGSRKTGWTLGGVGALLIAVIAAWFGFGPDGGTSGGSTTADAPGTTGVSLSSETDSCLLSSLPGEADEVVDDILVDGPFNYPDNDGTHFGNYEGRLPAEHDDFYREYTVETPGLDHRGARRIVTGGGESTDPEVWYYTDDHYESFCEIPDAE